VYGSFTAPRLLPVLYSPLGGRASQQFLSVFESASLHVLDQLAEAGSKGLPLDEAGLEVLAYLVGLDSPAGSTHGCWGDMPDLDFVITYDNKKGRPFDEFKTACYIIGLKVKLAVLRLAEN
jgi:hypothetical protein